MSVPPPSGPSFDRPEVPAGVLPAPPAPSPNGGPPPAAPGGRPQQFATWAPFAAIVCAYATAVFVAIVIGAVVAAAGHKPAGGDLPTGVVLAATLVQDLLLIGFTLLFARACGARLAPQTFGIRPVRIGSALLWALAAFGAFYLFTAVWSAAIDTHQTDDLAQQLGARDSSLNLVVVGVLVSLVAPVAEELFFRGFLFPALWRRLGWVAAGVVTGLLFGLVHAGGTPAVFLVPLAVLGFLLCALYRWTGSILPGMGVHAFNNALALAVTLHWQLWQGVLAVIAAPAIVVYGVSAVSATRAARTAFIPPRA
jgi:membrane protease YdiL (CAAX protease family)